MSFAHLDLTRLPDRFELERMVSGHAQARQSSSSGSVLPRALFRGGLPGAVALRAFGGHPIRRESPSNRASKHVRAAVGVRVLAHRDGSHLRREVGGQWCHHSDG